jgi:hypothetical protein
MDNVINTLTRKLGEHISLSQARLECLSGVILGLLCCESVSLRKLSLRMGGTAKRESHYRRLQRFFW